MNPESLMHERGSVAVVAHKDQFTREEKDALRDAVVNGQLVDAGKHYVLLIAEEPDADELALAAYEEFEDDSREESVKTIERGQQYGTPFQTGPDPSMEDLRGLKVDELKKLADDRDVDLTGLKLKDDILGRLAAHFGLDPAS